MPEKTVNEERLISAVLAWADLGHVGDAVDPAYCPGDSEVECKDCPAQTELSLSLEAVLAERA
jgi:hypothetical protein